MFKFSCLCLTFNYLLSMPLSALRRRAVICRLAHALLCMVLLGAGVMVEAQTATFSYSISTLGGGFNTPFDVAVDRGGNVYVADEYNEEVKKIPAGCVSSSCVTNLASGSFSMPYSVAVDESGNVFVVDYNSNGVYEIVAPDYTTVNQLAKGHAFNSIWGVAVDASYNVYVTDSGASAVYEIMAPSYTTMNPLGGGFSNPEGVAVDGSGNVFVADEGHNAVKEITFSGGLLVYASNAE